MGCYQSKIEDEENVSRCRRQKQFVKQAIKSRNAFASSHASYLLALHATGIAFRKFAEGEFREQILLPATPAASSVSPLLPPAPGHSSPEHPTSISLPPMALQNTPLQSETVTVPMSPARSLNYQLHQADYFYNDSPPLYMYGSADESASFSLANDAVGSPSFHQLAARPEWVDWFQLFEPPTMPMHMQQERRYKEVGEIQQMEVAMEIDQQNSSVNTEKQEEQENDKEEGQKTKGAGQNLEQGQEKIAETEKADQIPGKKLDESEEQKVEEQTKVEEQLEERVEPKSEPFVQMLQAEKKELTVVTVPPKGKYIPEVLRDVQEEFLKASESGRDVSKILEASKVQYHSTYFDSKGLSDHSARLLRGLSWGSWSPKTPLSWRGAEGSDESSTSEDAGAAGSHGSTLDRIYAWEKKLYQEVKAVELIHIEFEKNRRLLRNLSAKGDDYEKIDKTRAVIKARETEMAVAFQAMEATSVSIQKIADEEMYLQLLELLERLSSMWKSMSDCHDQQKSMLFRMEIPHKLSLESTGISLKQAAMELESALNNWQLLLGHVMISQREYVQNLTAWLRLSWFRPEKESKRASAARRVSPTYTLCRNWQIALEKLPEKPVIEAIKKFLEIIRQIIWQQNEEQRVYRSAESLAKDLTRQHLLLNQSHSKPLHHPNKSNVSIQSSISENREFLETLKHRVEDEKENFTKAVEKTRALTLEGLQKELPQLFHALSEFATLCSKAYQNLLAEIKDGSAESKID